MTKRRHGHSCVSLSIVHSNIYVKIISHELDICSSDTITLKTLPIAHSCEISALHTLQDTISEFGRLKHLYKPKFTIHSIKMQCVGNSGAKMLSLKLYIQWDKMDLSTSILASFTILYGLFGAVTIQSFTYTLFQVGISNNIYIGSANRIGFVIFTSNWLLHAAVKILHWIEVKQRRRERERKL